MRLTRAGRYVLSAFVLLLLLFLGSEYRWRTAQERAWAFDVEAERRQLRDAYLGADRLLVQAQGDAGEGSASEYAGSCGLGYDGFPFGFPWLFAAEGTEYVFPHREFGGPISDPAAIARQVADDWRTKRLTVSLHQSDPLRSGITVFSASAETRRGSSLSFLATEDRMTLRGYTACGRPESAPS